MTVNLELATLMRVIEDQQDKMPEGQYLEAMNALGSLHRQSTAVPSAPVVMNPIVAPLFSSGNSQSSVPLVDMNLDDRVALNRVKLMIPEHQQMTPVQWVALSQEERTRLNRQSVEAMVDRNDQKCRNPNPLSCPFISRHAVGPWRISGIYTYWTCVCGYTGKAVYWKKHEESERHQDWAKHRTVSRRIVEKMKKLILADESGDFIPFNPYSPDSTCGIRYFSVCQDKNEWTHPELFAPLHIFTKTVSGTWFVHRRDYKERQYVE